MVQGIDFAELSSLEKPGTSNAVLVFADIFLPGIMKLLMSSLAFRY
jgi:hypothetical protein